MKRCDVRGAFAAYAFATLVVLALGAVALAADRDEGLSQAGARTLATQTATPAAAAITAHTATAPWVCVLKVDGTINPSVAAYIDDGIGYASSQHAAALVIELDTPGG